MKKLAPGLVNKNLQHIRRNIDECAPLADGALFGSYFSYLMYSVLRKEVRRVFEEIALLHAKAEYAGYCGDRNHQQAYTNDAGELFTRLDSACKGRAAAIAADQQFL